ncbi:MAG: signal peptidase I [Candidatus Pacebacteria bacterium]|nr:signal peptidase I [Candidatus Paceibacterota bacterium]
MAGMTEETKQAIWEMIKFAVITVAIVVPVRAYVAQPFIVSGSSMVPTFHNGEYLVIDEFSYHLRGPSRGEVVVFRYPKDPSKFFIKRVIGLPGETLNLSPLGITIVKENKEEVKIDEPYITNQSLPYQSIKLKNDEYFVMGDNRPASLDSRVWGPVEEDLIKGRVFLRLLPISEIGLLPGHVAN